MNRRSFDSFVYGYISGVPFLVVDPTIHVICFPSSFMAQLSAMAPPISKTDHNQATLLSSWDPLSLPANFKPFVSITGPVSWFEDWMEEIIWGMQERLFGWRRILWYVRFVPFFCVFVLIFLILETYPYPSKAAEDRTSLLSLFRHLNA